MADRSLGQVGAAEKAKSVLEPSLIRKIPPDYLIIFNSFPSTCSHRSVSLTLLLHWQESVPVTRSPQLHCE